MYYEETAINVVKLVKEKYIIEFNKLKDFGFHKEKLVVTHDSSIYDEAMENSIKWFKR